MKQTPPPHAITNWRVRYFPADQQVLPDGTDSLQHVIPLNVRCRVISMKRHIGLEIVTKAHVIRIRGMKFPK
jgi:hypothetical protein